MNAAQKMMALFEGYFGIYKNTGLRTEVMRWIEEMNIPQGSMRAFYRFVIHHVSTEYNNRPDVNQLERLYYQFIEERRVNSQPPALTEPGVMSREDQAAEWSRIHALMKRLATAREKQEDSDG